MEMYESIGSSIDSFVKSIPGIGGILSDVLLLTLVKKCPKDLEQI